MAEQHFKQTLDNSQFLKAVNESAKAVQDAASGTIQANDREAASFAQVGREAERSSDDIKTETSKAAKANKEASKQIQEDNEETEASFGALGAAVKGFAKGIGSVLSVKVAMDFAQKMAIVRGEFQKLDAAFSTMVGLEKGTQLMKDAVEFAAHTPFDLGGVAQGAKQLLAYGSAAEDVMGELKMLGDIAAGLSMPLGDLVYLYGTTRTQGRMFTQDMRQFMGRGVPLAEELAKQFGVAKDKVGELVTEGKVGFDNMKAALESMVAEGGKFNGLMDMQSKTIAGQIANLGDSIEQMFNRLGEANEGAISKALEGASWAVDHYKEIGRLLGNLVGLYGTYKAALIAGAAVEKAATAAAEGHTLAMQLQEKWTKLCKLAQDALNKSMLTNPYVLAAAAALALVGVMIQLGKATNTAKLAQEELNGILEGLNEKEQERKAKTDAIMSSLAEVTKTDGQRAEILRKLVDIYPSLLDAYGAEKLALMDLKELKEAVATADKQASLASLRSEYEQLGKKIAELKAEQEDMGDDDLDEYYSKRIAVLEKTRRDLLPSIQKASEDAWSALTPDNVKLEAFDKSIAHIQAQISALDTKRLTDGSLDFLDEAKYGALKAELKQVTDQRTLLATTIGAESKATFTAAEAIAAQEAEVKKLAKAYEELEQGKGTWASPDAYATAMEEAASSLSNAQKKLEAMKGASAKLAAEQEAARASMFASLLDSVDQEFLAFTEALDKEIDAEQEALNRRIALQDGFADEVKGMEAKANKLRLEAMEEGMEKRLALIDLEEKETLEGYAKHKEAMLEGLGLDDLEGEAKTAYDNLLQATRDLFAKQREEAKKAAEQKATPYAAIFGDLSRKTIGEVKALLREGEIALAGATDMSEADMKALADAVTNARNIILAANPWTALADGMDSGNTETFNQGLEGVTEQFNTLIDLAEQLGTSMGEDWSKGIDAARAAVGLLAQSFKKVDGDDFSAKFSKITGLVSAIITAATSAFQIAEDAILKGTSEASTRIAALKGQVDEILSKKGVGDSLFTTDTLGQAQKALEGYNAAIDATKGVYAGLKAEVDKASKATDLFLGKIPGLVGLFDATGISWALGKVSQAVSDHLGRRNKEAAKTLSEVSRMSLESVEEVDKALNKIAEATERNKGKIGKTYLGEMKAALEEAKASMQEYDNAIKEMVGDIGNGLLTAIRTARQEGLDAVTEIGKALSESLESILESNIWAATMGPVFNQFTDNLREALNPANADPTARIEDAFAELFDGLDARVGDFYALTDRAKEMAADMSGLSIFGSAGTVDNYTEQIRAQEAYLQRMERIAAGRAEAEEEVLRIREELARLSEGYQKGANEALDAELAAIEREIDDFEIMGQEAPQYLRDRYEALLTQLDARQKLEADLAKWEAEVDKAVKAGASAEATRARIEVIHAERAAYEQTYPYIKEQLQEVEDQISKLTKAQWEAGEGDALQQRKKELQEQAKWFEDLQAGVASVNEGAVKRNLDWYDEEIARIEALKKTWDLDDIREESNQAIMADLAELKAARAELYDILNPSDDEGGDSGDSLVQGSIDWLDDQIRLKTAQLKAMDPNDYTGGLGKLVQDEIDALEEQKRAMEDLFVKQESLVETSEEWYNVEIGKISDQLRALSAEDRLGAVGQALEAQKKGLEEALARMVSPETAYDPTSIAFYQSEISKLEEEWRTKGEEWRASAEGEANKAQRATLQELLDTANGVQKALDETMEAQKGSADYIRAQIAEANEELGKLDPFAADNKERIQYLNDYIAELGEQQRKVDEALHGLTEASLDELIASAKARKDLMDMWTEEYGDAAQEMMAKMLFDPEEYVRLLEETRDTLYNKTLDGALTAEEQATYNSVLATLKSIRDEQMKLAEEAAEERRRLEEEAAEAVWEAWEETYNALAEAADTDYQRLAAYRDSLAKLHESGLNADQISEAAAKIVADINKVTKTINEHLYSTYRTARQEHADTLRESAQDIAYIEALLGGDLTEAERGKWEELLQSARDERRKTISDWARAELESGEYYETLFGDLAAVGVAQARAALDAYREVVGASSDLTDEVRNEMLKALEEVERQINELADSQALEELEGKFEDITATIDAMASVLGALGVPEALTDGLRDIKGAVEGIKALMTSTSFSSKIGAVATIITSIISFAKSVKDVFGGSADQLTAGVKALAKEYDKLERAVSKTYGQTALRGQRALIDNLRLQIAQYDQLIEGESGKTKKWWDIFGLFSANPDKEQMEQWAEDKANVLEKIDQMEADLKSRILQTDAETFSNTLNDILRTSYDDMEAFYNDLEALVSDSIENIIAESIRQTFVVEQANEALDRLYQAGMSEEARARFDMEIRDIADRAKEEYDRWRADGWFAGDDTGRTDNAGTISRAITEETATWIKGGLQNINVRQADQLNVTRAIHASMEEGLSDLVRTNRQIEANTAVLHDIKAQLDGITRSLGTGRELR